MEQNKTEAKNNKEVNTDKQENTSLVSLLKEIISVDKQRIVLEFKIFFSKLKRKK